MKHSKVLLHCALCVIVLTAPAVADHGRATVPGKPVTKATSALKDVALSSGGIMRGVALNSATKPVPNANVVVQFGPHVVARTKTKADGSFAISGLRGGIHHVTVGSQTSAYRLWTNKVAPPNAVKVVAVNGHTKAVRGQMMPPVDLATLGLAGAALGIGLVVGKQIGDDDKKSKPASP